MLDSLRRGGAETSVVDLTRELSASGRFRLGMLVVDPSGADGALLSAVRPHVAWVRHLGGPALWDPRLGVRIARAVAAGRPDVVHAHMVFSAVGLRAAKVLGAPVADVTTIHTAFGPRAHGTALRTRADIHTAWRSDLLTAPSEAVADAYASACRPRLRRPIEVVPNGARPRPRTPGFDRAAVQTTLGATGDEVVVLVVARLDPGKGVADLVEALATPGCSPRLRVVVAGDGPERDRLDALAARLAPGRVALLGRRDDIGDLLEAADVVCLPSHHEALPISVLEAMHAGRAVVATRVGALPEVVQDGVTGLLVDPHAPAQLAAALTRLAGDPALRAALGAGAARAARARHGVDVMAARYAELYARVAAARGR